MTRRRARQLPIRALTARLFATTQQCMRATGGTEHAALTTGHACNGHVMQQQGRCGFSTHTHVRPHTCRCAMNPRYIHEKVQPVCLLSLSRNHQLQHGEGEFFTRTSLYKEERPADKLVSYERTLYADSHFPLKSLSYWLQVAHQHAMFAKPIHTKSCNI